MIIFILRVFRVLFILLVPCSPFQVCRSYLLVHSFTQGSPFIILYWVLPFKISSCTCLVLDYLEFSLWSCLWASSNMFSCKEFLRDRYIPCTSCMYLYSLVLTLLEGSLLSGMYWYWPWSSPFDTHYWVVPRFSPEKNFSALSPGWSLVLKIMRLFASVPYVPCEGVQHQVLTLCGSWDTVFRAH